MTRKEVKTALAWASSCTFNTEGLPIGVSEFQTFLAINRLLKGKLYWFALAEAYTGSDNLFAYRYDVRKAFQRDEPARKYLMNWKERAYLSKLPESITIYRGMTEDEYSSGEYGISWTLKEKVAQFYAFNYTRNFSTNHLKKCIKDLTINKSEVIAFFNGRKEYEIIYIRKLTI